MAASGYTSWTDAPPMGEEVSPHVLPALLCVMQVSSHRRSSLIDCGTRFLPYVLCLRYT